MSICDAGYERCEEYREQIDMLKARLAEGTQGRRDLMEELTTVVERLDEAHRVLRLCIPSLQRDGRPHVVTMVQAALGDIVAVSAPDRETGVTP